MAVYNTNIQLNDNSTQKLFFCGAISFERNRNTNKVTTGRIHGCVRKKMLLIPALTSV